MLASFEGSLWREELPQAGLFSEPAIASHHPNRGLAWTASKLTRGPVFGEV
jgi:hypothetical protein